MKAEISVKKALVGAVIGKGGMRIRRLRKISNAQIHISQPNAQEHRTIEIYGSRYQIEEAKGHILDLLYKEDPRVEINIVVTLKLQVASELIGSLIGKAGKNISRIENSTDTNIQVESNFYFILKIILK